MGTGVNPRFLSAGFKMMSSLELNSLITAEFWRFGEDASGVDRRACSVVFCKSSISAVDSGYGCSDGR